MKTTKKKIIKSLQKLVPGKVSKTERVRFQEEAADLNKSKDSLGRRIKQQSNQLSLKNKQLRHGADKALRAEEQIHILTKAMEATADGIFIIDVKKVNFPVIYSNQSFHTMTGYAKKEILGRNYFLLYGADADTRIIEEIKSTMNQGESFHGEMLSFQKNGKKYWNLLRMAPVRDSNGEVTHYVGIQTDISLMRQRDLEIKEQREELLHVTRVGRLAEFVSSLAHEISQPLTAILSYAQAAQRILGEREPQLKEIFQYIINDDKRASEVIRRLRALLKKSEPEMKLMDMNALIKETIVFIATDASVRNNILKIDLDPNLPLIYGDRIQLQQVILNLISNSFDAIKPNQVVRDISISTSRKDLETIIVKVRDSGCGIPAENLPKLFIHFFTSKADGLGMGLSISRSIIEAHGGHLEGKNNSDQGVTFSFTLPIITKGDS